MIAPRRMVSLLGALNRLGGQQVQQHGIQQAGVIRHITVSNIFAENLEGVLHAQT